jgi:hypothetical protein
MKVLERELDDTSYGILVITQENRAEPWLNFEAGALSKSVGNDEQGVPRVVPLLVDIDRPTELTGPVSQFQAVNMDKNGIRTLVMSIAEIVNSNAAVIEKRFERTLPELDEALKDAIVSPIPSYKPARTMDDKVDEVLRTLRSMRQAVPVIADQRKGKLGARGIGRVRLVAQLADQYGLMPLRVELDENDLVETAVLWMPKDFQQKAIDSFVGDVLKQLKPPPRLELVPPPRDDDPESSEKVWTILADAFNIKEHAEIYGEGGKAEDGESHIDENTIDADKSRPNED